MITLEDLKAFGANTDEGLGRCMGMEEFYVKLVNTLPSDANFEKLKSALEANDPKAVFEASHALKGVLSNLAVTPLVDPVTEICERVRGQEEMPDLSDVLPVYEEAFERFRELNK